MGGPSAAAVQRARGNLAWVVGSLVVFAGWIALAHAVPATNANQFKVKAWLSLVAVGGSLVQLATISRVYSWTDRIPPGAVRTLASVHRWSGRTTLAIRRGGHVHDVHDRAVRQRLHLPPLRRLLPFAAVVVVKVVVLRADRWGGLLPYLGVLAIAGWVTCFLTKGFSVIF